ncbi:carbohydrate ABC transporter permease [Naumannella sp. ID2617S]|uniref:Glycerol-3-phosphate ABC transporter permease n=1 Tax=Enemella dayhoffiae TaxID=2016507 RepID=A0A255GN39_9ACTN|nr:carbohydrate ABC transporter permease [Enemella dayhoffiae]NNG21172.1 carbohydrate ABC transporter permease [Naumannella sp. ID2617S]OYO17235.1 glycerol-3-phosphate ABC transporter permease [Enemella dayhoffiae]
MAENSSTRRGTLGRTLGYLGLLVTVLMILVPIYFIVITSLKERPDIYAQPVTWLPNPFTGANFVTVMTEVPFLNYLVNSIVITTALTIAKVTLGVMSAYALSFLRFPGRNLLFIVVISALMVPNQITVISNYALVAQLGWRNTFQGIIIPLAGVAFGTFLLRNHFGSLPTEIIEAARMDGAGPLKLLFRVVLPMSWPTLIAFTLITIVNEWNEYLWPFLMANNDKVAPLPVGLTLLQNNEGLTNWGPVMAGTVLTMLPILVIFLVLQKQMIKGLTAGAVKG